MFEMKVLRRILRWQEVGENCEMRSFIIFNLDLLSGMMK
jgi:hypothetical protein